MLRGEIELDDFPDFGSRARLHRGQALRVLREAAKARSLLEDADAEGEDDEGQSVGQAEKDAGEKDRRDELEVTSAAVMLLVIQSVRVHFFSFQRLDDFANAIDPGPGGRLKARPAPAHQRRVVHPPPQPRAPHPVHREPVSPSPISLCPEF